jgi:hypothetical protein
LKLYALGLAVAVVVTATASAVHAKNVMPRYFPAIAAAPAGETVTGPVDAAVVYFDVLHYGHASLTIATAPIEPPELYKFINTPPRALGFALPTTPKSAFDALDARASDWVYKARELNAHYQADIKALAAVETAYKQLAATVDKRLELTAPADAAAAIAATASAAGGPNGDGAKLARQIGYVVDGTTVKRDPAAPPSCDLDAPTADGTNAPIFVAIDDACIQNLIDERDTLVTGALRAAIETSPADRISAAQADFLRTELASINLTPLQPNGADNLSYASKYADVQSELGLLVALTPDQFELPTDAGKCTRGIGGTKTTVTFTAVDRFQSGEAATVHRDVLTVMCYPRLEASAGIGYTTLPKTVFSTAEGSALLNAGGLPPAPAPTFQADYRLTRASQSSHIAGVSLMNLCLCAHPSDGTNAYLSFGFIAPDGEPLGAIGGLSLGFGRTYYFTFGEHYGIDTVLDGPNNVGDLVPANFAPPTSQHWILRPAAAFTIGL